MSRLTSKSPLRDPQCAGRSDSVHATLHIITQPECSISACKQLLRKGFLVTLQLFKCTVNCRGRDGSRCPILVDVRTASEWNDGHANCAQRIPVQDDSSRTAEVLALVEGDRTHPVVVYCRSGVRAESALTALTADGFTDVTNGGGWISPAGNAAVLEELCTCDSACPSSSTTYTSCTELLAAEGDDICTGMEDVRSVHCQHSCGATCPPEDIGSSDSVASGEDTGESDEGTLQSEGADNAGAGLQSVADTRTSGVRSKRPWSALGLAILTMPLRAVAAMVLM